MALAAPHVVVDAVADSDLYVIAEACRDAVLMTGGSAVAMPLPDLYRAAGLLQDGDAAAAWRAAEGPALVLSGSCSAMTQAQVARYAAASPSYQLDPLALVRDGVQPVLDWFAAQSGAPMIYATAAPGGARRTGQAGP